MKHRVYEISIPRGHSVPLDTGYSRFM